MLPWNVVLVVQLAIGIVASLEVVNQPETTDTAVQHGISVNMEIDNMNYFDLPQKIGQKKTQTAPQDDAVQDKKKTSVPKDGAAPDDHDPFGLMDGAPPTKPKGDVQPNLEDQAFPDHLFPANGDGQNSEGAQDSPEGSSETPDSQSGDPMDLGTILPSAADLPGGTGLLQLRKAEAQTVGQSIAGAIERTIDTALVDVQTQLCGGMVPAPSPVGPIYRVQSLGPPSGISFLSRIRKKSSVDDPEPSPGPAPMMPIMLSPAFAPMPGPAPAPGPACANVPQPKVHVGFSPGKTVKVTLLNQHSDAVKPMPHVPKKTIKVNVTVYERPDNGQSDLPVATTLLQNAVATGLLKEKLKKAIYKATGIMPKIRKLSIGPVAIPQYNFAHCGHHMTTLVSNFSVHYTRRQVPMALFNSCTTFVSRMSFSNDHVLDSQDTVNCRSATKKFARVWQLGNNVKSDDFRQMCFHFCEAKYGNDAPQCRAGRDPA
jgi:hypothetical protein